MNLNKKRPNYKALVAYVALIAVSLFTVGRLVKAYSGETSGDVFESGAVKNVYYQVAETAKDMGEAVLGAASRPIYYVYDYVNGFYVSGSQIFDSSANATLPGTLSVTGASTFTGAMTLSGALNNLESTEAITASNTITIAESGKTFYLSGATSTQTLPATTTANGAIYRFYVKGAVSGDITIVTAGSANIIEGTLIVAGAVVDCDDEDTITIVSDGENVGDFVELRSNGTNWFIGASGALTGAKMTCTAT